MGSDGRDGGMNIKGGMEEGGLILGGMGGEYQGRDGG